MTTLADTMRTRIISLVTSNAAQKISFRMGEDWVGSPTFMAVWAALMPRPEGQPGIDILFGPWKPGEDAEYQPGVNAFKFRHSNYGTTPYQRQALIHECVHAWHDVRVPRAGPNREILMQTKHLRSEAMAYVAGCLFDIYDRTPAGGTPTVPDWATEPEWTPEQLPTESSVLSNAYRIALSIRNQPHAAVVQSDLATLEVAIRLSPTYPQLHENPNIIGFDGL